MSFIKRAWRGEERLWKVFWLLGYLVPLIFVALMAFFLKDISANEERVISDILDLYVIFWIICVWRCAKNVKEKSWIFLVKLLAVFQAIGVFMDSANNLHGN